VNHWRPVLQDPTPGRHIAQLYTDDDVLVRGVTMFLAEGLRGGGGAIVIALSGHRELLRAALEAEGLGVDELERRGRLVLRDSDETLAALLVNGMPDASRFDEIIGGAVRAVRATGASQIRAFGEMVDRLRHTDLGATERLEELWNEFLAAEGIALLCGYRVDPLDQREHRTRGVLPRVARTHSHLIVTDDPARFEDAVWRAYDEVFGHGEDTAALRRLLLDSPGRRAAMLPAPAAVFAAADLGSPVAELLLERARQYYRRA